MTEEKKKELLRGLANIYANTDHDDSNVLASLINIMEELIKEIPVS